MTVHYSITTCVTGRIFGGVRLFTEDDFENVVQKLAHDMW